MKELYTEIQKLIINNYKGTLNDEILDLITVAVMALYIKNPKMTLEKLPKVLNKIDILAGDNKVSNYILEKYPNYPWDPTMDSESAMAVRALNYEVKPIDEDWTMAISTTKINTDPATVIAKTIHELTHLLRFGGIEETKKEITVKDGVCTTRIDKRYGNSTKNNYYFEEGIVEKYTKDTIENFYTYLSSKEDLSFSKTLASLKRKFNGKFKNSYLIEVSLLELLYTNEKMKELIENTFEQEASRKLVNYYDSLSGTRGAFSLLSAGIDRIEALIDKGDIMNAIKFLDGLKLNVRKILLQSSKVKK